MEESDIIRHLEENPATQKCPRCGKTSLKFIDNTLRCSECSFEAKIGGL